MRALTPVRKLLAMKAAAGEPIPLTEYTATGNPVTFETNISKALTCFTVPFVADQEGNGNPSPTNIRPIIGINSLTIYQSGEDTTTPATYTVTFPADAGTVYGGTIDILTGMLTVTQGAVIAKYLSWDVSGGTSQPDGNPFVAVQDVPFIGWGSGGRESARSNALATSETGSWADSGVNTFWWNNGSTGYRAIWGTKGVSTASEFIKFLSDNNVIIVGALANPQKYQLTQQQIKTLKGVNTIWTDTNGINTVKYLKRG